MSEVKKKPGVVDVSRFFIKSDFREDPEDVRDIADSIKNIGLINPITCRRCEDGRYEVLAGRRRFRALVDILQISEFIHGQHYRLNEIGDEHVIQLEENLRRTDFKPAEVAKLVKHIHDTKVAEFGRKTPGGSGEQTGWTMKDTASLIGRDVSFVSRILKIAENPEIAASCSSVAVALEEVRKVDAKRLTNKIAAAKAERAANDIDLTYINTYTSGLRNLDAIDFLAETPDESVDLVHTDPPYGINLDKIVNTLQYQVYEDDYAQILALVSACLPHFYRILKPNKYCIIWTSFQLFPTLVSRAKGCGFFVDSSPIVWMKLNTAGLTNSPTQTLGSAAEIALYCWKGQQAMMTVQGKPNIFPVPTIRKDRIHAAQKPEQLIELLLNIFSHPGDVVLDCFSGSGSTMRGCYLGKRKFIGSELDVDHYNQSISYTIDWYKKLMDDKSGE